jgi:hypothetical protein
MADMGPPAVRLMPSRGRSISSHLVFRLACYLMIAAWVLPSAFSAGYDFIASTQPITVVPTSALGPSFMQIGPAWLQIDMFFGEFAVAFLLPLYLIGLLCVGLGFLGIAAAPTWRAVTWAALTTAAIGLQVTYALDIGGLDPDTFTVGPPVIFWARLAEAIGFLAIAVAMIFVLTGPGMAHDREISAMATPAGDS